MNIDYHLIGKRIKAERNRCGYTQEYMAEHLDVSIGYISQVERGITKISLDLLASIATILNCDIASLVTGTASGQEQYLLGEITEACKTLNQNDKQLILGIIHLIRENRE